MIVILKRDVKGAGKAGEIVKVSDGYARNMLLPRGYAVEATKGNIRKRSANWTLKSEQSPARAADFSVRLLQKTSLTRLKHSMISR